MPMALALLEEVPFESAGQIEEKVELYERVLGPRYSKDDKCFAARKLKSKPSVKKKCRTRAEASLALPPFPSKKGKGSATRD